MTFRSRYRCKICQREETSRVDFVRHVEGVHNIAAKAYMREHGAMLTERRWFECKVCRKPVLWQFEQMVKHFEGHGVKARDYYEKHLVGALREENLKRFKEMEAKVMSGAVTDGVAARALKWSENCTYACHICNK